MSAHARTPPLIVTHTNTTSKGAREVQEEDQKRIPEKGQERTRVEHGCRNARDKYGLAIHRLGMYVRGHVS